MRVTELHIREMYSLFELKPGDIFYYKNKLCMRCIGATEKGYPKVINLPKGGVEVIGEYEDVYKVDAELVIH